MFYCYNNKENYTMSCLGGGKSSKGSSGGAKAAIQTTVDPMIASKPFLEVKLKLPNAVETITFLTTDGKYLPGIMPQDSGSKQGQQKKRK